MSLICCPISDYALEKIKSDFLVCCLEQHKQQGWLKQRSSLIFRRLEESHRRVTQMCQPGDTQRTAFPIFVWHNSARYAHADVLSSPPVTLPLHSCVEKHTHLCRNPFAFLPPEPLATITNSSQAAVARGPACVYSAEGFLTFPGWHNGILIFMKQKQAGFLSLRSLLWIHRSPVSEIRQSLLFQSSNLLHHRMVCFFGSCLWPD